MSTEGTTCLKYGSVDHAGNVEQIATKTVRIDKTAPVTTDDSPSDWATAAVSVHLTGTDAGSGTKTTYYRVNAGA